MKAIAVCLSIAVMGLSACDNAPPAPPPGACGSADTLNVLKNVVLLNLGRGQVLRAADDVKAARAVLTDGTAPMTVESVRTVSRDESLGRSVCAGQLRITVAQEAFGWLLKDPLIAATVVQGGWRRDGDALSLIAPAEYVSQLTDDKKQVHVELQGPMALVEGAGWIGVAAWLAKDAGAAPGTGKVDTARPPAAQAQTAAVAGSDECAGEDMSTTAGMMSCANKRFTTADTKLNEAYKATMARLAPDRQQALRAEQRAWVAARDPACEAEATRDGMGGTAATLEMEGCRANRTEARTAEVASFR